MAGKAMMISTEVIRVAQVKIGMRIIDMPGARRLMMVTMKLKAPAIEATPRICRPSTQKSTSRPEKRACGQWRVAVPALVRNERGKGEVRIKPGLETVQKGQPKQAVQRARGDAGKNAGQREEHRDVEDDGAGQEGPVGKAVQTREGNVARADLERHDVD